MAPVVVHESGCSRERLVIADLTLQWYILILLAGLQLLDELQGQLLRALK